MFELRKKYKEFRDELEERRRQREHNKEVKKILEDFVELLERPMFK